MKHINQLLFECVDRLDKRATQAKMERKRRQAAIKGLNQAYETLGIERKQKWVA